MQITQPDLAIAIMHWLAKHGVESLLPRQMDAVLVAATLIQNELAKPFQDAPPGCGEVVWLASDCTGASSKYMLKALRGAWCGPEVHVPHDADDFGRCVGLLDAVPELRKKLILLQNHGSVWNRIRVQWDAMENLWNGKHYDALNKVLEECRN